MLCFLMLLRCLLPCGVPSRRAALACVEIRRRTSFSLVKMVCENVKLFYILYRADMMK